MTGKNSNRDQAARNGDGYSEQARGMQMKPERLEAYHARMQRVLAFIEARCDEPLDLERLSGVAAFSRHHFQRQFTELFGITPIQYVQLVRMKRASRALAFRDGKTVTEIALDAGYEAPEAFARAFKRVVGQTPSQFRAQPDWSSWHSTQAPLDEARSRYMSQVFSDDQVRIVDFPDTPVGLIEHRGDPATIGDTIRRFIAWRREAKLPPSVSGTFNILYTDPATVDAADYRMDICAAAAEVPPNDAGVIAGLIPAGRCAVVRMTGSPDNLRPAVSFLYADWLPRSGEELRDFPLFAQRVHFHPDVPESEAITDVFLPLQ